MLPALLAAAALVLSTAAPASAGLELAELRDDLPAAGSDAGGDLELGAVAWLWTGAGAAGCPHYCTCSQRRGLRRADCSGRRLASVELALPKDTEAADLSRNLISSLEDGCFQEQGLVQLRELSLRHNAIRSVGPWAFAGLRRLRTLDLSYNHLQALYPHTFANSRGLKTLLLAGNNLARLPADRPLLSSPRLQVLDLSSCKLAHLGAAVLSELPALASLNLSANYLIQLQAQALASQSQLQALDLGRNPLACDLNTRQLLQGFAARNVTVAHPCPAPAAPLQPIQSSKHLSRLLADVAPGSPEVREQHTHESMVVADGPFAYLDPFATDNTEGDNDLDFDEADSQTPRRPEQAMDTPDSAKGGCPPLFPDRTSKNPPLFRGWFDPIPSFWAAVFGCWVGFAMGLVLSSCACHPSFWRALCLGPAADASRRRPRRTAREQAECYGRRNALREPDWDLDPQDVACALAACSSAPESVSTPLVPGSSCTSLDARVRPETPPPAYSDLMPNGLCPL